METEAETLEPISGTIVHDLEIKCCETVPDAFQNLHIVGERINPSCGERGATGNSSILNETAKNEGLHSLPVELLNSSEGEIFDQAPSRVQVTLGEVCEDSDAGLHEESPIKESPLTAILPQKDLTDGYDDGIEEILRKDRLTEAKFKNLNTYENEEKDVLVILEEMQTKDEGNNRKIETASSEEAALKDGEVAGGSLEERNIDAGRALDNASFDELSTSEGIAFMTREKSQKEQDEVEKRTIDEANNEKHKLLTSESDNMMQKIVGSCAIMEHESSKECETNDHGLQTAIDSPTGDRQHDLPGDDQIQKLDMGKKKLEITASSQGIVLEELTQTLNDKMFEKTSNLVHMGEQESTESRGLKPEHSSSGASEEKGSQKDDKDGGRFDTSLSSEIQSPSDVPAVHKGENVDMEVTIEEIALASKFEDEDDILKSDFQANGSKEVSKPIIEVQTEETIDMKETAAFEICEENLQVASELSPQQVLEDEEQTPSENKTENHVIKEGKTDKETFNASATELVEEIHLSNEEKENEKLEKSSEVVHDESCKKAVVLVDVKAQVMSEITEISIAYKDEGMKDNDAEQETKSGKVEEAFEEKHTETETWSGSSNYTSYKDDYHCPRMTETSDKEHAQETQKLKIEEGNNEIENKTTSDPLSVQDEEASHKFEHPFHEVFKEPETTVGIVNNGKEITNMKEFVNNSEERSQDDNKSYENTEQAASNLMSQHQNTSRNDLRQVTDIANEKHTDNAGEDISDELAKHKSNEEIGSDGGEGQDSKSLFEYQSHDTMENMKVDSLHTSGDDNITNKEHAALSNSKASMKDNTPKETNPQDIKESVYQGHRRNTGGAAEVVVEEDIHERKEHHRSAQNAIMEDEQKDETRNEMDLEKQIKGKTLDDQNELTQRKQSYEVVADNEMHRGESIPEKNSESVFQKDLWENKFVSSSSVVSENFLTARQNSSTGEDANEKHFPEKDEENLEQSQLYATPEQGIEGVATEDQIYKPDGGPEEIITMVNPREESDNVKEKEGENLSRNIHEVPDVHLLVKHHIEDRMDQNHIEAPDSAYNHTQETTNIVYDQTEEMKLETGSVPECRSHETNGEMEVEKTDKLTDNNHLDNMIPDIIEPDETEISETQDKDNQYKITTDILDNENIPETVGEKREEGANSACEEQIHQANYVEENKKLEGHKEMPKSDEHEIISESIHEDHNQVATSESKLDTIERRDDKLSIREIANTEESIEVYDQKDDMELVTQSVAEGQSEVLSGKTEVARMDKSNDNDHLNNMIPEAIEPTDGTEVSKAVDDDNQNKCTIGIHDNQRVTETVGEKHEEGAKPVCEEHIQNKEFDRQREMTNSNELEIILESVPAEDNQLTTSESEVDKIEMGDNNLRKMILETVKSRDDIRTTKVKEEDDLDNNLGDDIPGGQELVLQDVTYTIGEKDEATPNSVWEEEARHASGKEENKEIHLHLPIEQSPWMISQHQATEIGNSTDDNTTPEMVNLNDDPEAVKVKGEDDQEKSMRDFSKSPSMNAEIIHDELGGEHAQSSETLGEDQMLQTSNSEHSLDAGGNAMCENKELEVASKSLPTDQSGEAETIKIKSKLDIDIMYNTVASSSSLQAPIETYTQKERDRMLEHEINAFGSAEVKDKIENAKADEEKTTDGANSASRSDQNFEASNVDTEEFTDDADYCLIEDVSSKKNELDSEEKVQSIIMNENRDEQINMEEKNSNRILEEASKKVSEGSEISAEILIAEQITGKEEATNNIESLSSELGTFEGRLPEDKGGDKFEAAEDESATQNQTNEIINEHQQENAASNEKSCIMTDCLELIKTKATENDENQTIEYDSCEDERCEVVGTTITSEDVNTKMRIDDLPVTGTSVDEAGPQSLHGYQRESANGMDDAMHESILNKEKNIQTTAEPESTIVDEIKDSETSDLKEEENIGKVDHLSVTPLRSEFLDSSNKEQDYDDTNLDILKEKNNPEKLERATEPFSEGQNQERNAETGHTMKDQVDCSYCTIYASKVPLEERPDKGEPSSEKIETTNKSEEIEDAATKNKESTSKRGDGSSTDNELDDKYSELEGTKFHLQVEGTKLEKIEETQKSVERSGTGDEELCDQVERTDIGLQKNTNQCALHKENSDFVSDNLETAHTSQNINKKTAEEEDDEVPEAACAKNEMAQKQNQEDEKEAKKEVEAELELNAIKTIERGASDHNVKISDSTPPEHVFDIIDWTENMETFLSNQEDPVTNSGVSSIATASMKDAKQEVDEELDEESHYMNIAHHTEPNELNAEGTNQMELEPAKEDIYGTYGSTEDEKFEGTCAINDVNTRDEEVPDTKLVESVVIENSTEKLETAPASLFEDQSHENYDETRVATNNQAVCTIYASKETVEENKGEPPSEVMETVNERKDIEKVVSTNEESSSNKGDGLSTDNELCEQISDLEATKVCFQVECTKFTTVEEPQNCADRSDIGEEAVVPAETETMEIGLQKNINQCTQLKINSDFVSDELEIAGTIQNIEEKITEEDDVGVSEVACMKDEMAQKQIKEDENEVTTKSEAEAKLQLEAIETIEGGASSHKVKIFDFMPSEQVLDTISSTEEIETPLTSHEEDSIMNIGVSSITTASVEDNKQELDEELDEVPHSVNIAPHFEPNELYAEVTNQMGLKPAKKGTYDTDGSAEVEKFEGTYAINDVNVRDGEVPDTTLVESMVIQNDPEKIETAPASLSEDQSQERNEDTGFGLNDQLDCKIHPSQEQAEERTNKGVPLPEITETVNESKEIDNVATTNEQSESKKSEGVSAANELDEGISDVKGTNSRVQERTKLQTAEGTQNSLERSGTGDEAVSGRTETSDIGLQKDTKQCTQLKENSDFVPDRLEIIDTSQTIKKKTAEEEDVEAPEAAFTKDELAKKQIQEDENEAMMNKEGDAKLELEAKETLETGISNYKVKVSDHTPSEQVFDIIDLTEKIENSPTNYEDSMIDSGVLSVKTASVEGIKQEADGELEKASHSVDITPQFDLKELSAEAINGMDLEPTKEDTFVTDDSIEVGKLQGASALNEVNEDNEVTDEMPIESVTTEASEGDRKEQGIETLSGTSATPLLKQVEKKEGSSVEDMEYEEHLHKLSIEQTVKMSPPEDGPEQAIHGAKEYDHSLHEENQQSDINELPVSRFLLAQILQEESPMLDRGGEVTSEHKMKEKDAIEQNSDSMPENEENLVSLPTKLMTSEASMSNDREEGQKESEKVCDLVSEEQSRDSKEDNQNVAEKDAKSPESNPFESSPKFSIGEDNKKDKFRCYLSGIENHTVRTYSMELTPLEKGGPGSKVVKEKTTNAKMVLDGKIHGAVNKRMTGNALQKDNEVVNTDVNTSSVIMVLGEEALQEEDHKGDKQISQEDERVENVSGVTHEEHTPSVPELTESRNLGQNENTLKNVMYDLSETFLKSSIAEGIKLSESLKIDSKVSTEENEVEKQVEITEGQMENVDNNSTEIPRIFNSEKVRLYDHAPETTKGTAENFSEEGKLSVDTDERQSKEAAEAQVEEEKTDEEKDEKEEQTQESEDKTQTADHNADKNASIILEARDAELKPAHKKHHNILSGVGSKVKHSIAKVKKAITGKSSHPKSVSPK